MHCMYFLYWFFCLVLSVQLQWNVKIFSLVICRLRHKNIQWVIYLLFTYFTMGNDIWETNNLLRGNTLDTRWTQYNSKCSPFARYCIRCAWLCCDEKNVLYECCFGGRRWMWITWIVEKWFYPRIKKGKTTCMGKGKEENKPNIAFLEWNGVKINNIRNIQLVPLVCASDLPCLVYTLFRFFPLAESYRVWRLFTRIHRASAQ